MDDIHFELTEAFPKLKEAGGFEFLRVSDRSRTLEIIPLPPEGYTVSYLKDVVQQAKLYVRPIQKNLSLELVGTASVSYMHTARGFY